MTSFDAAAVASQPGIRPWQPPEARSGHWGNSGNALVTSLLLGSGVPGGRVTVFVGSAP